MCRVLPEAGDLPWLTATVALGADQLLLVHVVRVREADEALRRLELQDGRNFCRRRDLSRFGGEHSGEDTN